MSNNQHEPLAIMEKLQQTIQKVMVLKDSKILEFMMAGIICQGHILLDDIPGVGKTMLAKTFANSLGLTFKRIQFTPDLLPSDVTGLNFFNQQRGEFEFKQGPVFTNILLADEINRATPRTQASLLESMQEATVTIDGESKPLNQPFLVLATQNPLEMEGTFPLPEAQLDRFLFCLSLGYPDKDGEIEIIKRFINHNPLTEVKPFVSQKDLLFLRTQASNVKLAPQILEYIVDLGKNTRSLAGIRWGASPRGVLYLARAAQALALLRGRLFVLPDDVQDALKPVFAHRIITEMTSSVYELTSTKMIKEVQAKTPVPVGAFAEGITDET